MNERDIQCISEMLARFSQYTDLFEQEDRVNAITEQKTETMGRIQTRVGNTGTTNRRTPRIVSETIINEAKEK